MRINVYAEEMTDQVEIIAKEIEGDTFTGLRLYLHLPVTLPSGEQAQGPFMHRPGDDDSSAVTFWGKRDLRVVLRKMLAMLDQHYADRPVVLDEREDADPARVGAVADLVRRASKAKKRPVLMSPENPDGWKLEELLLQLQIEVQQKSLKIEPDPRLIAKTVMNNNGQIIGLLAQAEAIQRQSYAQLDDMAPNEGPLGKPRIGRVVR